ncbi:MAG: cyclase family protein [Solirubrobacterales bacterium]
MKLYPNTGEDDSASRARPVRDLTVRDLTQPLSTTMPRWPGTDPIRLTVLAEVAIDGLYERQVEMPEHVGTHVDAPAHFAADGARIEALPLEHLVSPGRLLDASGVCGKEPDFALDAATLIELEREQGIELAGEIVALVRFGWDRYLTDGARYLGGPESPPHFPGLAPSAAELLVERGVRGIGVDTMGVEPGIAVDYPVHRTTLPAGLFHIEGLVNLWALPPDDFTLIVAPLPLVGGSGAPARVLALIEE